MRPTNIAPISHVRCPIHKAIVSRDGNGTILTRCRGCEQQAARAARWIASGGYQRTRKAAA